MSTTHRERFLVKEALESPETLATVLYFIVKEAFGDDAFFWDPTTLYLELRDEFGAEPATEVMDRLSAVQVLVTGDVFFQDPSAFINMVNTFADGSPSFSVFNPAEVEEIAWTAVEVALIRDLLPFSYNIKQYVKKMLEIDGYGGDYPDLFDEILGPAPDRADVIDEAQEIEHEDQRGLIEDLVTDNLKILLHQANKLPKVSDALWNALRDREREEVTLV
jgi:hypothetical protein